jgi:uncharacterized repeat protein (TIGR03806 family)
MKKNYFWFLAFIIFSIIVFSCSDKEEEIYTPINNASENRIKIIKDGDLAPISVDLSQVPYTNLSQYGFFFGEMKNQTPRYKVLSYEPASSLFSDYSKKKRWVWMPSGTKATYNGDSNVLELPVGSVLIKTFYYDNVQNVTPVGSRRILETRLMIRKSTGWIFAEYVWNASQTEATLDLNGSNTPVTWIDENNITKNVNYRLPNLSQCIVCHKSSVDGKTTFIPIGIKPQNLNFDYQYSNSITSNQLSRWIQYGYLQNGFDLPSETNTCVNYNDLFQPIDLRARSYVDINCAHCHQNERHCDYRPMRFAFSESGNENGLVNMGVCVDTQDMQGFSPNLNKIIKPQEIEKSMLYYRINTNNETYRMPLHGRTIIHTEGVNLIKDWINSLQQCQ